MRWNAGRSSGAEELYEQSGIFDLFDDDQNEGMIEVEEIKIGSEKWKQWLSGLRTGEKLPKKNQLLLILLAGILLLVIVFLSLSSQEAVRIRKQKIQNRFSRLISGITGIMRNIWRRRLPGSWKMWRGSGKLR